MSSTGVNDCAFEEQPCENLVTAEYDVTYSAQPAPGWRFAAWENCGTQFPDCSLYVPAATVAQFLGRTMPPLRAVFVEELGSKMVVLGDSITAQGSDDDEYKAIGYWVQALSQLGWPAQLVHNAGQGGANLQEILSGGGGYLGIEETVDPYHPDFVVLQGGTNQIGARTKEQLWAEYDAVYQALKSRGYKVVPCTQWAREDWYAGPGHPVDTTSIEKIQYMNRKIREYPEPVCDLYNAVMRVPDNGVDADTQGPKDNMFLNDDNVHPSDWGALVAGQALATALSGRITRLPTTLQMDSDGKDSASADVMAKNPLMEGVGGTVSGGTGSVADHWSLRDVRGAYDVVASKELHPQGYGWYQVITFSALQKGDRVRLWSEITLNQLMTPGQAVELEAEVLVTAAQPGERPAVEANLRTSGDTVVTHGGNRSAWLKPASNMPELDYGPVVVKTFPQTVPEGIESGSAAVFWTLTAPAAGTYTVKIGRVSVQPATGTSE